ncbi:MAG: TIR domain-containing protein [Thaumarchaeota archaeon]|nr:TIR domain-containing protein [Nitrososphaerota archaeon]
MARRVFFSFDYDRDVWRASQVRNSGMTSDSRGFIDAADWESIEREGDSAIKRWINEQLDGTTVTAVLIGAETDKSEWVRYEIERSWEIGNGILGIRIHNIKDQNGLTDYYGSTNFGEFCAEDGNCGRFDELFDVYDWKDDGGYDNLEDWIENAADKAGR